ncbi:MAG: [FeFe] hydrogenase H-cluster radical SAM maturase HydG [Candidatus Omnitrophica bacterium]|nr:[FeFe] hydrogenase H-cluster radical SAM maturase HydG [Candidatus Omnitrophota bacterium]
MKEFIDINKIEALLEEKKSPLTNEVKKVIAKAKKLKGLSPADVAVLLQCRDKKLISLIFKAAREVKEAIYGKRLVLFAPLYISNFCRNSCLYCAFRLDNRELKRRKLSFEEIRKETKTLIDQGHKRLLMVAGEESNLGYVLDAIKAVYKTKSRNGEIRRVNVNVAPLSVEGFCKLKKSGIGTFQMFQETYHKPTYEKVHVSGPKKDYSWRLYAMDRAQEAGIDDVGIGVLFGLYDYRFEVLALLYHALHLERFGAGPHTISVPRIEPAFNAPLSKNPPFKVSDDDFKKLVAIIRLAVPYTGIILTTRENPKLRDEVFKLGVSQISAGSRTSPGSYGENIKNQSRSAQFSLGDTRTQSEIIKDISLKGYIPSFCTACYRRGRTGKAFMELAKPGRIKNLCLPNAILTYKEYLLDYGSPDLRRIGARVISKQLKDIKDSKILRKTLLLLEKIDDGNRDLYL